MKRVQPLVALVCVLSMVSAAYGQAPSIQSPAGGGPFAGVINPYRAKLVAPIDLGNSSRLESLLRGGNLYLSLQDAIALALENNLDIQLERYQVPFAAANILRAQAGGLLRGVPASLQSSSTAALSQLTGSGAGSGQTNLSAATSSQSTGTSAGGTIITATGSTIPTLDPILYASANWGHYTSLETNSLSNGTNSLVYRNDNYIAGIQQGFTTGTTVTLGLSNSIVNAQVPFVSINPSTSASLSLTVTQHLLQGFGLAVNNRNIRIAKNTRKVSDLVFKAQVIQTVSAVISGYWDLVSFNENVKVHEQALALARKLLDDNRKQVEIGTLAPIEVVRAESEVASNEQQLVNAQTQVLQQETALKNALSRNGVASPSIAEAHIIPTGHITVPEREPARLAQDLMAKALESRPEIAQTRWNVENTKIGLEGTKAELRPTLDLTANLTNNALAGTLNPVPGTLPAPPVFAGGYGTVLGQLFGRDFPNYSIGFQLNVPLRNRAAQADMIMDQLNLRQQELQQQQQVNNIRVEVRNALIAVEQAGAAYRAALKASTLAEETLEAEQKKYALGASTIFFVIQYQRDLAQARYNEVAAESQYAKAKVQLDQATGSTLEANNISMDEAVSAKVSRLPSTLPPLQP